MNGRYDQFLRYQELGDQLRRASSPLEYGRVLMVLGVEMFERTPEEGASLYSELERILGLLISGSAQSDSEGRD